MTPELEPRTFCLPENKKVLEELMKHDKGHRSQLAGALISYTGNNVRLR